MQPLQFLPAIWATVIGVCFMAVITRICVRTGWVDKPDQRKHHDGAIPLAGGLSIATSLLITTFTFGAPSAGPGLILAATIIFVIGFIDDKYPLRARYRFGCQLVAATILAVLGGATVQVLGDTFGPVRVGLGMLAIPFSVIAIAGVINAFNMIDGVDGLAGGQGFIAMSWLLVAAATAPTTVFATTPLATVGPILFPMLGATLAFLTFNMRTPWRQRASVFLGDGGSMLIGLVVAWGAIMLASKFGGSSVGPASVVWIIAVPLMDMFSCIARRLLDGQTPMTADRKHMHHLLMAKGFSANGAVTLMNIAAFLCGFIGIAGWLADIPQYFLFWPLLVLFLVYLSYVRRFWRDQPDERLSTATIRTA